MALARIKKIQLIASKKHKDKIMELLQNAAALQINEIPEDDGLKTEELRNLNKLQEIELDHANTEFAIKLLSSYAKKKSIFSGPSSFSMEEVSRKAENFDHKKITEKCSDLEEKMVQAKNEISNAHSEIINLKPWKNLEIPLNQITGTDTAKVILGNVKMPGFENAIRKIHKLSDLISTEIIEKDKVSVYLMIIFSRELEKEIRQMLSEIKFQEADLPDQKATVKEYIDDLENKIKIAEKTITETESEFKKLTKHLEDLQISCDYFGWQLEKAETEKKIGATDYNFVINGWIPAKNLAKLEKDLAQISKEYDISEIPLKKGEEPPVIIKNSNFMSPFEAVTKIYGLPKHNELDPTPFLAAYFIIFFGLCLTDAGYGLVMFIAMALILKFFKLAEGIRKLVKLLMYGGIATFFIGAVFGGWFGLTTDQVPSVFTYIAENGEKMFIFQKVNAITSPITVLILALAFGFIQVTMGVTIKFIHSLKEDNKKDAILDNGTWVFMLVGIGFFILSKALQLSSVLQETAKYLVISATVILILTQGRSKKNIIAKFFSGILSLYGLVGYMSDILSYSRILALGLATTIIGLAVNTVTDLAGGLPYIGWLLMIIVFIGGHLFNLLINALGAFIHSGRLQFVEFFTKFMEGGGAEFKPFSKKTKYIFITK